VSTTKKGDKLEDDLYDFLLDQQHRGDLIFGLYAPQLCKIFKKKKYFCDEREGYVTFDVVIEVRRQPNVTPSLHVVFECKNHNRNVEEDYINSFSDKLSRIFPHANKGVIVVTSGLQSGAEKIARRRKMGIVKFNPSGVEIVAERRSTSPFDIRPLETQFFQNPNHGQALKFCAYHDGKYFSSVFHFMQDLDPEFTSSTSLKENEKIKPIPFISFDEIDIVAQETISCSDYNSGAIDLCKICSTLKIDLIFSQNTIFDENGNLILGSANFDRRSISVNLHENKHRERFTIAHELGHFQLGHRVFLGSEDVVERDLLINIESKEIKNVSRLEFQANTFASLLLMPRIKFMNKAAEYRKILDIRDRGHGYIFVDDQPCNYIPYNHLLSQLSSHFEVSRQAIEVRLCKEGMLTDQRKKLESRSTLPTSLGSILLSKH